MKLTAYACVVALMVVSCKRDVDMVIPDAGPTSTTATATATATSTTAPTTTTTDAVEPLATLSSGGKVAPLPIATVKVGDGGVKPTPSASTTATGLPTGVPTGLPTTVPTGVATLPTAVPTPTGVPTVPPTEPPECGAARLMKQLGRTSEASTLRIKCVEKGGKDPFI